MTDNFGELLHKWRQESGFSQDHLSEVSAKYGPKAVSQSTISQAENGHLIPSKSIVLQLAAALDLDKSRTNQFLVAAHYGPSSDFDYDKSRAMRLLATLLSDPIVTPLLEPLGDELIAAFIEAWEAHARAKKAQYKRDWRTMREVADEALAKLWSASEQLAAYLHDTVGVASLHLGDLSEAEEAYFRAANLIQSRDDPYLQGMVLTHLGEVHRDRSEWKKALAKFEAALKEFSDLGDEMKGAWIQRKIGVLYLFQAEWQEALRYLERSERSLEMLGDHYELVKVQTALGWAYSLKGEWEKALEFRKRGLELAKKHRVPDGEEDYYLQLRGHLYYGYDCRQSGEYEQAHSHLRRALRLSRDLGELRERGFVLLGIARLYLERSKAGADCWDRAERLFELAAEVHKRQDYKVRYASTLTFWATLYLQQPKRNVKLAIDQLTEARSRFTGLQHHYYLAEVNIHLSETCRLKRDFPGLKSWYEEGVQAAKSHTPPYYKQLARLRLVKARACLDQKRLEEVREEWAKALLEAARFNLQWCKNVCDKITEGIRIIQSSQTSQETKNYCQSLLTAFRMRVDEQPTNHFTEQQRKLVDKIEDWLAKLEEYPTRSFRVGAMS